MAETWGQGLFLFLFFFVPRVPSSALQRAAGMERPFSDLGRRVPQAATRGPRSPRCMPQNTTPAATLAGFSQMAAILALCAKETHVGGARVLR